MSSNLSIYVGPYLEVEKTFDWYGFGDALVTDGRGEFGVDDDKLILIPNQQLAGVERQMSFDRHSDTPVVELSEAKMGAEKVALFNLAEPIFDHCQASGIQVRLKWGIVPCWS